MERLCLSVVRHLRIAVMRLPQFRLLWLFRKFINQTNAFQSWCAQQAYGAYIVHLFVLLAVQHATDGLLLPGIVKFFLIATIASILSFLLTYLLRLIPGVKRVL